MVSSESSLALQREFAESGDDRATFYSLFEVGGDDDFVTARELENVVRNRLPGVTRHRYNRWLRADGCEVSAKRRNPHLGCEERGVKRLRRRLEQQPDAYE